uniref:Uncharacterized protein n=1 Tax=Arundo donax TaxID=35708 RepID=A0A0A8YW45_ARUDO
MQFFKASYHPQAFDLPLPSYQWPSLHNQCISVHLI